MLNVRVNDPGDDDMSGDDIGNSFKRLPHRIAETFLTSLPFLQCAMIFSGYEVEPLNVCIILQLN